MATTIRLVDLPLAVTIRDTDLIPLDQNNATKVTNIKTLKSVFGVFSPAYKEKLDGIETGANKYIHPNDINTRHVTDTQIALWDSKADGNHNHDDKYMLKDYKYPASDLIQDDFNQLLTKEQINILSDKYTKKEIDDQFILLRNTTSYRPPIASKDNLSDIIRPLPGWTVTAQDTNITYSYNGTEWVPMSITALSNSTIDSDGFMSKEDKGKLDGIEAGANLYKHPATHLAGMITQDANHKFVTNAQIASWNAKADSTHNHDDKYRKLIDSYTKEDTDKVVNNALKNLDVYTKPEINEMVQKEVPKQVENILGSMNLISYEIL